MAFHTPEDGPTIRVRSPRDHLRIAELHTTATQAEAASGDGSGPALRKVIYHTGAALVGIIYHFASFQMSHSGATQEEVRRFINGDD